MQWNLAAALTVVAFTGTVLYAGATLLPDVTGLTLRDVRVTVVTTLAAVGLIAGRHSLRRRLRYRSRT